MFKSKMYISVMVILFVCKFEISKGVIAGIDAEPGEFPFIVSLRNETNKHYCGGSLITRRHVVTAAHCLFIDASVFDYQPAEMYKPWVIKAVVDTTLSDGFDGEYYQALKLSPHPQYNITNHHSVIYDIGIIELRFTITNGKVVPISLPTQPVIYEKMATVAGWGIDNRDNIEERNKMSRVLQKADVQVILKENCINIYLQHIPTLAFVTEALFLDSAFCSLQEYVNVCYRDSGSPLIQDGNLVGIVISGNDCQEGSPDIYTSVYHYLEFIIDCVEDRCTAIRDVRKILERTSL